MLHVIKKLCVPRVILRYIMMNYLDLASIKTIILNIKEMNVLDDFSKNILSNAKYGLSWNCEKGHLSTVQYLIELGNSHRLSPNSTCRYSDKVSLGADIHADYNWALRAASENGHQSIVEYLVSLGADIHADNNWALRAASENGHRSIVEYLVSLGADIHAVDNSAIKWASGDGHLSTVQYLVSVGADIH